MNERQRQAYLQAMGIQTLYPRLRVAGARPSPVYDYPLPAQVATDAEEPSPVQSSPVAAVRSSLRSRLVDLDDAGRQRRQAPGTEQARNSKPQTPAGHSADPSVSSSGDNGTAVQDDEQPLQFRVQYLQISQQLAVLQEVPWQSGNHNPAESEVLLRNILLALEQTLPARWPAAEVFNWPLSPDLPASEATPKHATQALNGFIAMRRQRDGFANLLVFTAQIGALLAATEADQDKADFHIPKLNCHITCVTSLQAMLAVPALKKEVWQQLQPLRARLLAG